MKPKQISRKLAFNKTTISRLSNPEMNAAEGGMSHVCTQRYTDCPTNCNLTICDHTCGGTCPEVLCTYPPCIV